MIPGFGLSKSISNTITASTGLAVLFAVVMMGGAVWYETRVLTQKTFERAGQIQTTFLSETLGGALRFGKVDALEASFASFKESVGESVEWIVVVNADGELVSQSDGTSVPLQSPDLKALAASATAAGAPQSDEGVIAAPVRFGPNKDVVGTVIVAYSNAQFARDLLGVLIHGAFVGLAVAVLAITMNILVLPRILRRPLEKLDVVLEKIGDGNLALEVPGQEKSNELGMIARRVEALRALLQQAEATRKGHEAAQRETQAARARMMDALDTGVGQVVAAARQGDFSQRVSQNFDDELIQSLATGVNLICEDVAAFLDETESATGGLAKGNTSLRMSETFSGRFAEVAAQLNAAMGTMSDLVGNLRDIDGEIRKTVGAVLDGSAEFSGQSESQAASLRQFAAVMNEISDSIDASAANAHQSSKKAGDANAMSRQGRDVCEEAISAMSAIQEHASKISEIVSVIDGIAFQTNLLALNAAVEAARAGESGKGFAVVASEVRTLAQRSADAARDISALIAESQAKVDNGAALVGRTGEFLSSISDGIKSVSTAVDEISGATRQQSQGIAEIKEEIKRIDQVSQNTASIAEKSAAQANDLNQKATNLSSLISYFKTKDGGNEPMLIAAE